MDGFLKFLCIIGGIIGIIVIVLIVKLIIWIFKHPLFGRILGLIFAIVSFILGLYLPTCVADSAESGEEVAIAICLSILYTISYLCALGAGSDAFDTYWDGTYSLTLSNDSIDLRKNISGGFIAQLGGGLIFGFFISLLGVSSMPFFLWLIPIILAVANVVLIIKVIRG